MTNLPEAAKCCPFKQLLQQEHRRLYVTNERAMYYDSVLGFIDFNVDSLRDRNERILNLWSDDIMTVPFRRFLRQKVQRCNITVSELLVIRFALLKRRNRLFSLSQFIDDEIALITSSNNGD